MGTTINFNDPKYHAPLSTTATIAEKKDIADLQAKYLQAQRDAEELRRLRQTPLPKTPEEAADAALRVSEANALGAARAKTKLNLPNLEQNARAAFKAVDAMLKHPGFSAAVGMPNPFKGGFGIGTLPWTPARDFMNRFEAAKSKSFMIAREGLKGAGPVTDYEGQKADKALAAMDAATSEEEFRRASQDFVDAIANGVKIARKQAQMTNAPYTYDQLLAEKARRSGGR